MSSYVFLFSAHLVYFYMVVRGVWNRDCTGVRGSSEKNSGLLSLAMTPYIIDVICSLTVTDCRRIKTAARSATSQQCSRTCDESSSDTNSASTVVIIISNTCAFCYVMLLEPDCDVDCLSLALLSVIIDKLRPGSDMSYVL